MKKTFISAKFFSMLVGGTISSLFSVALAMTDTITAGRMLGEAALAAVNLVIPTYSFSVFLAMVLSIGAPILYSNEIGAFQEKEAGQTFSTALVTAAAVGFLLFLGLEFFGGDYLRFFDPGETILRNAGEYFYWMKAAALLLPLNELISGMVFADGDEKLSTAGDLTACIGNLVLSVLFCRRAGLAGIGLATFISILISFLIKCLHFLKKRNSLRLEPAFSLSKLIQISKYSIVDASAYLFAAVFGVCMTRFLRVELGIDALVLVSVIVLFKEFEIVFDGIGEAITPLISVYLGEESYPGVREIWKLAGRAGMAESFVITVLMMAGAPLIVRLLGIQSPELAEPVVLGLRLVSLTLVFTCRMYLDSSYSILADRIPLGVWVCALRDIAVNLPLALLGGHFGGIFGMFAGLAAAPVIGYALSYFWVVAFYGKENYTLFLSDKEKQKQSWIYEFEVRPDSIVWIRDRIGRQLEENGCSGRCRNRTMLLFEEFFMYLYESGPDRKILAECFVELGEKVRLITKDDGEMINLTDPDRRVGSLREYLISGMMEKYIVRKTHLMTLSYNRNVFEIDR